MLLWKIVKPRDRNEIKPPMGKINKVSYLQKNKRCYNLETTFQKKVSFSH